MAKTNYQYEKRQRELEKKRKAEEKAKKKAEQRGGGGADGEAVEHAAVNGFDPGLPPELDGPLV
ncbi:hypothetical protein [Massilia sp. TS11]|uniref:hypothetical protein n=1 Tax=Massilia sp. TS11 TaxID=2908003 RepID=UPI001EDA745D|nr:hypothetical protein [Massilia sp. TS11]MCG2583541.1 hypothetical protein [Massilia sp. TS11]